MDLKFIRGIWSNPRDIKNRDALASLRVCGEPRLPQGPAALQTGITDVSNICRAAQRVYLSFNQKPLKTLVSSLGAMIGAAVLAQSSAPRCSNEPFSKGARG